MYVEYKEWLLRTPQENILISLLYKEFKILFISFDKFVDILCILIYTEIDYFNANVKMIEGIPIIHPMLTLTSGKSSMSIFMGNMRKFSRRNYAKIKSRVIYFYMCSFFGLLKMKLSGIYHIFICSHNIKICS